MPDTLLQHYESIEGQHSSEHESEGRIVLYDGIATTGEKVEADIHDVYEEKDAAFLKPLAMCFDEI